MTSNPPSDSVAALLKLDPDFRDLTCRMLCNNYEEFISFFYKDLDKAIREMENNCDRFHKGDWHEDDLTIHLSQFLKGRYYDIEHDTSRGGHCDIVVKTKFNDFEWLGEAKIWKGVVYVQGGWEQLTERYTRAARGAYHGGLILYVKIQGAAGRLSEWQKHFEENIIHSSITCSEEDNCQLDSTHVNIASGRNFNTKHIAIALWHASAD